MAYILTCLLFTSFSVIGASSPQWHKGSVVLVDNAVVIGELSVDADHHIVLVRNADNTTSVFPGHKVSRVYFYDEKADINRRFMAHRADDGSKIWKLYEVVLSGEIHVLRLKKGGSFSSENPDRDDFDYFLLKDQKITSIKKFSTRVLPLMEASCPSIKYYMQRQKLNPFKEADIIGIVAYFNISDKTPAYSAKER